MTLGALVRQREKGGFCLKRLKEKEKLAPRARFELATLRLTAECSTIELPGKRLRRDHFDPLANSV